MVETSIAAEQGSDIGVLGCDVWEPLALMVAPVRMGLVSLGDRLELSGRVEVVACASWPLWVLSEQSDGERRAGS